MGKIRVMISEKEANSLEHKFKINNMTYLSQIIKGQLKKEEAYRPLPLPSTM